jgi:hypothetical protein
MFRECNMKIKAESIWNFDDKARKKEANWRT